jgi:hypothetical protein
VHAPLSQGGRRPTLKAHTTPSSDPQRAHREFRTGAESYGPEHRDDSNTSSTSPLPVRRRPVFPLGVKLPFMSWRYRKKCAA